MPKKIVTDIRESHRYRGTVRLEPLVTIGSDWQTLIKTTLMRRYSQTQQCKVKVFVVSSKVCMP